LNVLNPTSHKLEWNIEAIAEVREVIRLYFEKTLDRFYEQEYYSYREY
jgi:hypothetical protein